MKSSFEVRAGRCCLKSTLSCTPGAGTRRKHDALEGRRINLSAAVPDTVSTLFSQVVKRKGNIKVSNALKQKIYSFIEDHPHVIQSPIANDLLLVKDECNPQKTKRVPKLLLQIPIRQLHNDIVEGLPEATDSNRKPLISDTKLLSFFHQN